MRYFFLLLVAFVFSCEKKQESEQSQELKEPNKPITLLLKQPVMNVMVQSVGMGRPGEELFVLDSYFHQHQLNVQYAPEDDTVVLNFDREQVQVNIRHKVWNEVNFLFFQGDSVNITYDTSGLAHAFVINRQFKSWDFSFDQYLISNRYKYKLSPMAELRFSLFITYTKHSAKDSSRLIANIRSNINFQNKFLDSLLQANVLSPDYHAFYKMRNQFQSELLNLWTTQNYKRPAWSHDNKLLSHQYYREFIISYLEKKIEPQIPLLKTTNATYRDYRIAFDTVVSSTEFTKAEKDVILYNYLLSIIKYFSKSDTEKYLQRFAEVVDNKNLPAIVKQKYNLNFDTSADLMLKKSLNEKTTLANVLAANKGNVVYVDFWASWCGPCIAGLPAAEKLRTQYKDQPVAFVYLSIDEKFDNWTRANDRHKLTTEQSFVVDNFHSSDMMEELKLSSIPRYLLFDQNGNLIHKNAPGPGATEVNILIDDLLKKK